MRRSICSAVVCLLQVVALGSFAHAQDSVEAPEGRFRFGPVRFTPSIAITSLGVDTNVFNEFDDPKQDTTAVFGPRADYWMSLGRGRVQGKTSVDYSYFRQYDSQRSFGTSNELSLSVPLNRLKPFVEGAYTNTRQRPGYEIDARARRREYLGRGGIELRLGGRSFVTFDVTQEHYRFESEDEFLGTRLGRELNRDSQAMALTFEQRLTPLTTFVVATERRTDRFVQSPRRDANAFKVTPGFEFKPFALIDGSVYVGYKRFETLESAVPDFSGVTAAADLGYTLRATRLTLKLARDVMYSYQLTEPYYLLTDVGGSVTQRITSTWDVVGRAARQRLDYRALTMTDLGRIDRSWQYGGGVGYRLGQFIRLGFDIDRFKRTSDIRIRQFEGWRAGGSVSYGVEQR